MSSMPTESTESLSIANAIALAKSAIGDCVDKLPYVDIHGKLWDLVRMLYEIHGASPQGRVSGLSGPSATNSGPQHVGGDRTIELMKAHNYFYMEPWFDKESGLKKKAGFYYCLCGWEGPDRSSYWKHLPDAVAMNSEAPQPLQAGRDSADWKFRFDELSAEFAILSRACGNWRTWPNEAESDHDHPDWKVAAKAILTLRAAQTGRDLAGEREQLAQWMIINSFSTGHGDTFEDLLKELSWQVKELRELAQPSTPGSERK